MDRRNSYRLELESGQARVVTPAGHSISMIDVSATGMALLVPPEAIGSLESCQATIELGELSFTSDLDLVRLQFAPDAGVRVGSRFRGLPKGAQQALSSFLIRGFLHKNRLLKRLEGDQIPSLVWREPKLIQALLRLHAMKSAQPLAVYQRNALPEFHLRLLDIVVEGGRTSLVAEVLDRRSARVEDAECTVVMSDRGSIHHFRSAIIGDDGGLLRLAFPVELRQTGFRDSIRARLSHQTAAVCFIDPDRGGVIRAIADVGARGFSFELSRDSSSFAPGRHIPDLRLLLPEGEITAAGIVRSIAPIGSTDRYLCGVQLLAFADRTDHRRWTQFVFHQTHPNVTLNAPRSAATAWWLLNSSDYLSGWTPRRYRARIARSYSEAWLTMSNENGHVLLLKDDVRPIGTVAGSRLYPKSWMVHHLGIDREERTAGKRRQFLEYSRELYSAIMYMIQHVAEADYFIIYVEQNKRWNELLYGDFVRSYSDASSSLLTSNVVYKFQNQAPHLPFVLESGELEISVADPAELEDLSERLSRMLLPIEMDAFSFSRDELGLGTFTAECAASGYERTRTVYLAKRGKTPRAALIAETGGDGTNVFGLLNTCRMVDLEPDTPLAPEVKQALLRQAIQHYHLAGKLQFIFVDDLGTEDAATPLGFERVSAGVRWIVKRDVVPGWLSYVADVFQLQLSRRERPSSELRVRAESIARELASEPTATEGQPA